MAFYGYIKDFKPGIWPEKPVEKCNFPSDVEEKVIQAFISVFGGTVKPREKEGDIDAPDDPAA